jgi:hypothetical protein
MCGQMLAATCGTTRRGGLTTTGLRTARCRPAARLGCAESDFAQTQFLRDLSSAPEAIGGREFMPGVLAHVGAGSRRPL